jgi:hypothetical protein
MKTVQSLVVILATSLFSSTSFSGVFKCTDNQGNTAYQSSPCAQEKNALEIDIKTGGQTDLSLQLKQKKQEQEAQKQQKAELQKKIEQEAQRKKDLAEQSKINQQLIKNNPIQFTAFAIPPYTPDNLPELVKLHELRLPEIEKFRRIAAQKALSTGECTRVEAAELSVKSKPEKLVFSINCSSAKTFFFNETELAK